ncbi:YceI family protein [Streptomyces fructofermentans]|uniref:Polyisoprenoid-binding protein n=1 Tax=Streptomyces fructofermentans TaxID=152141 RepID=A0A918KU08_9ACTN|nr:YceI family protein [Streptomyces fructofermentans]GGX76071.1 polyisoprenoid-binding protein [Streptomyces fructofermentans]
MPTRRRHLTVATSGPGRELTGAYIIDPVHSTIGFAVKHAMVSNVRGRFDRFEGLLRLDGSDPSRSEAHVSIQTDSVDTGIRQRDAHLTGPDFLDCSTFPLMSFRSTEVVPLGGSDYRLTGSLRMKDVELPLDIAVTFGGAGRDLNRQHRIGFEGAATLRRSDWGLTWNSAPVSGGALISDKVTLLLDVSAIRVDPATAA